MMVEALVQQLRPLLGAIERFDRQIAALFRKHPDRPCLTIFRSGCGPGPRLVAAFGTDRDRFQSAQQAQQLFGIAPVTSRAANNAGALALGLPKFLRQTFHEFAGHSALVRLG